MLITGKSVGMEKKGKLFVSDKCQKMLKVTELESQLSQLLHRQDHHWKRR
jgi:hypothetical protein